MTGAASFGKQQYKGSWEWRKRPKNKGGRMKKRRGRKYKFYGRKGTNGKVGYFVAKYKFAGRVNDRSITHVFLHRNADPNFTYEIEYIRLPRCYSYPPRIDCQNVVRYMTKKIPKSANDQ